MISEQFAPLVGVNFRTKSKLNVRFEYNNSDNIADLIVDAPIDDAINEHPAVAESAIVGYPHDVKGSALYGYVTLKDSGEGRKHDNLRKEINQSIADRIGPIAKLDKIQFTEGLPKTRSGKIMRRILRKIAEKDTSNLGDISTLLNPEVVQDIMDNAL